MNFRLHRPHTWLSTLLASVSLALPAPQPSRLRTGKSSAATRQSGNSLHAAAIPWVLPALSPRTPAAGSAAWSISAAQPTLIRLAPMTSSSPPCAVHSSHCAAAATCSHLPGLLSVVLMNALRSAPSARPSQVSPEEQVAALTSASTAASHSAHALTTSGPHSQVNRSTTVKPAWALTIASEASPRATSLFEQHTLLCLLLQGKTEDARLYQSSSTVNASMSFPL